MKLALLFVIALLWIPAPARADSSDVPQWYGTIHFSKTLTKHTDDPPHFQGRKGKKFFDVKINWSGTIKFLPGDKSVVVATYTLRREADAREDKMNSCPWKDEKTVYHDYENLLEQVNVSVNREDARNRLLFRPAADGSYQVSVIVNGGNQVPKAAKYSGFREIYDECTKPALDRKPQDGEGSEGMESLTLKHVQGKAKPGATALKGSNSGLDDDDGKLSYSWDLTLAAPQLVARAKATPSPVVRGDSVTLDGKASTGKIDKYEWQFTPDGECLMPKEGMTLKLTGATVTFKALCDFTAELTVSNSSTSDRASQPVMVEARKGSAWETKFQTAVGKPLENKPLTATEGLAGANQCTPHSVELATNHWLHTTAAELKTWRDSGGYVLAQVQDSGPFKGAWYVQSQSLKIDRQERVNALIVPGSTMYQLNESRKNKKNIDDWNTQVKAHEAMHSSLVKEALEMLGHDGDPAVRIEKLVGVLGEKQFDGDVDLVVRGVETVLHEASLDPKVTNRMRADSRFQGYANVWISKDDSSTKRVGPLWSLGD